MIFIIDISKRIDNNIESINIVGDEYSVLLGGGQVGDLEWSEVGGLEVQISSWQLWHFHKSIIKWRQIYLINK